MTHLFAYGTLMCDDIMREVSACVLQGLPGVLQGYSRRCVKNAAYPAITADESGKVNGILYLDLPATSWQRLDRFEGEMYARRPVQIELEDRRLLSAATYVAREEFMVYLEEREWDFEEFLRAGKTGFQNQYKGYRLLE